MKKIVFSCIVGILLLSGCSRVDDEFDFQLSKSTSATNDKFDIGIKSVQKFTEMLDGGVKNVKSIKPIVNFRDTLLYVVNYENNQGWLIVSGDKRTQSILATSDNGTFDLDNSNPGVKLWLDDIAENIYALKQTDEGDTTSVNYQLWNNIEGVNGMKRIIRPEDNGYWELMDVVIESLPSIQVGPLIQTKWGQGSPWNSCVPYNKDFTARCPTGCVAVAGAQMLYYLHYNLGSPAMTYSTGSCIGWSAGSNYSYQFSFSNPSSEVWDLMARNYYSTGTNYAAVLMGYVGQSIGMEYNTSSSGATTKDLVGFFSNNGVNSSYQGYDYSNVMTQLKASIPVIARAYATKKNTTFLGITISTSYSNGHAWIIDGYETKRIKFTYYYQWVSGDGTGALKAASILPVNKTKTEESISNTTYLIMNWGWNGSYDSGRYSTTGDWKVDDYNFRYEKAMISNFKKK